MCAALKASYQTVLVRETDQCTGCLIRADLRPSQFYRASGAPYTNSEPAHRSRSAPKDFSRIRVAVDNPAQALRAQTSVAGIVRYVEAINVMGSEGRAVTTARLSDHLAVAVPSVTARLRRLYKKGCTILGPGGERELSPMGEEFAQCAICYFPSCAAAV